MTQKCTCRFCTTPKTGTIRSVPKAHDITCTECDGCGLLRLKDPNAVGIWGVRICSECNGVGVLNVDIHGEIHKYIIRENRKRYKQIRRVQA
jgi:DnaJ-class molecular chaperone